MMRAPLSKLNIYIHCIVRYIQQRLVELQIHADSSAVCIKTDPVSNDTACIIAFFVNALNFSDRVIALEVGRKGHSKFLQFLQFLDMALEESHMLIDWYHLNTTVTMVYIITILE